MDNTSDRRSDAAKDARPSHSEGMASEVKPAAPASSAGAPPDSHPTAPPVGAHPAAPPPIPALPRSHLQRNLLILAGAAVGLAVAAWFLVPWLLLTLNTVSTDDAYVNGHVTFVSPRVPGQVVNVLVDDNNRVHKGDLLVQLDKEPYQIQVDQKKAGHAGPTPPRPKRAPPSAWPAAIASSSSTPSRTWTTRSPCCGPTSPPWTTAKAKLAQAKADYDRAKDLAKTPGPSASRKSTKLRPPSWSPRPGRAGAGEVYQVRVGLGLPAQPEMGDDLTQVPPDLDQTFSTVRQALAELLQTRPRSASSRPRTT